MSKAEELRERLDKWNADCEGWVSALGTMNDAIAALEAAEAEAERLREALRELVGWVHEELDLSEWLDAQEFVDSCEAALSAGPADAPPKTQKRCKGEKPC